MLIYSTCILEYLCWNRNMYQSYQVSRIRRDVTHLEGLKTALTHGAHARLKKRHTYTCVIPLHARSRAEK